MSRDRGQIKLILLMKREVSEHSRFFSLISDTEFLRTCLIMKRKIIF